MTAYAPGSPGYRRVVVALFLAGLASFATIHATQPLLPELAHAFGVSPATSTLSLSATTFALGLALLFVGPLSDAVGRVRIIHVSLLASAVLTLAIGFAGSWSLLVGLRAAIGVVAAGLPAVAVPYLREEVDRAHAARATGLYIGGTGIGGMSGRLVAGFAADLWGWRGGLVAVGVIGLLAALAVCVILPASRGFTPAPLRPRALLGTARRALADRGLLCLDAIGFLSMGALGATFNAAGFRLARAPYELSTGLIGMVFVVYAVGSLASARAGRLADRHGPRGVAIGALAIGLLGEMVTLLTPLPLVIVGITLVTVGFFACHGVVSAWVGARAGIVGVGGGQASALYLFFYYLGSAVAGTAAGAAWSAGGWSLVVAMTGTMFAVGAVLAASIQPAVAPRDSAADGPASSLVDRPVG